MKRLLGTVLFMCSYIFTALGCVSRPLAPVINWSEVPKWATVSIGDPKVHNEGLLIPVDIQSTPPNSLYVLAFEMVGVESDEIRIRCRLFLPESAPTPRDAILVKLERPILPKYRIVNVNKDGTTSDVSVITVPNI